MPFQKIAIFLLGVFSLSTAQAHQYNHLVSDTRFPSHIKFELRNSFIGSSGNVEGTYNGETVAGDLGAVSSGCPSYIQFRLVENILTYDLLTDDMKIYDKKTADACVIKYAEQSIKTFSAQLKTQKLNMQSYSNQ